MFMRRTFIWTMSFFFILWTVACHPTTSAQDEIQRNNQKIYELEQMKMGYEARALNLETRAEYLQFDQEAVLETRRILQIADENRAKAALIQTQIDELKARNAKLEAK